MSLLGWRFKLNKSALKSVQRNFACGQKGVHRHSAALRSDGHLTDIGAQIEAERCLLCVDAPCAKACPADTKPDKFLRQLHFENPLGAAETVLDNNPLGGVCGTVCPVSKLCEGACTRKDIDGPVKIGAVQRYLHDYGIKHRLSLPPVPEGVANHRTAIIGSGPAGLAAARELRRRGSEVTVFERRPEAGGALRYALSPLRIEHSLVEQEVSRISQMGVKFLFNTNIHSVEEVHKFSPTGSFDAVFVSPGLQVSRGVDLTIEDEYWRKNNITGALSFLDSANADDSEPAKQALSLTLSHDKHVVIIGGGSVAMDCAITAKALGAKSIHIIARESLDTLPADEEEIRLAQEAGGIFYPEALVTRVGADNTVQYQSFAMHAETASNVTSRHGVIHAQTVIVAAGQVHDDVGRELIRSSSSSANDGHIIVKSVADLPSSSTSSSSSSHSVPNVPANSTGTTSTKTAPLDRVAAAVFAGGDAVRGGGDTVVRAVADGKRAAVEILPHATLPPRKRVSLATEFVGLQWENPFTLSSSPVTNSAEMIARAYDAGFSGAYYKTLNREDKFHISHPSPRLNVVHGHPTGGMDIGIQNMEQISDRRLEDNLKDIAWLRKHYPTKMTAVSIMGYCDEDWEYLAQAAEGAGAHLLELNFSCPQMARSDAGHHVGQQFGLISQYTAAAKRRVKIPVVAKLTPNITDMVPAALAAQEGGADAVSAINTVKSISHVDLETLHAMPTIQGKSAVSGFSGKGMRPIGLRFVSELARDKRLKIPISGMGGIYTWRDAAEYMAVGARNLQVTTSVMQHGVRVVEDMINGLEHYLERNQWASLEQLIGRSNASITVPANLDTETEVVSVIDPLKCIGCGICTVACRDGAAHAIHMEKQTHFEEPVSFTNPMKAVVDSKACVGCKLCQFVCPVGAITFHTRARISRPDFSK